MLAEINPVALPALRIAIEKAVAIAKDIGASNYIDDQEEGSCYSQRGEN